MARLIFVVGTGTGVGKTTVAVGSLAVLKGQGVRTMGWKPVETGGSEDSDRLREASVVQPPSTLLLREPISPHRAARLEGRVLPLDSMTRQLGELRSADAEVVVVETAGGLFTPLTDDGRTNADWVRGCLPAEVVLVAANRLGCLHEVIACHRAFGHPFARVVLTGQPSGDASASSNAEELGRWGYSVVSVATVEAAGSTNNLY